MDPPMGGRFSNDLISVNSSLLVKKVSLELCTFVDFFIS